MRSTAESEAAVPLPTLWVEDAINGTEVSLTSSVIYDLQSLSVEQNHDDTLNTTITTIHEEQYEESEIDVGPFCNSFHSVVRSFKSRKNPTKYHQSSTPRKILDSAEINRSSPRSITAVPCNNNNGRRRSLNSSSCCPGLLLWSTKDIPHPPTPNTPRYNNQNSEHTNKTRSLTNRAYNSKKQVEHLRKLQFHLMTRAQHQLKSKNHPTIPPPGALSKTSRSFDDNCYYKSKISSLHDEIYRNSLSDDAAQKKLTFCGIDSSKSSGCNTSFKSSSTDSTTVMSTPCSSISGSTISDANSSLLERMLISCGEDKQLPSPDSLSNKKSRNNNSIRNNAPNKEEEEFDDELYYDSDPGETMEVDIRRRARTLVRSLSSSSSVASEASRIYTVQRARSRWAQQSNMKRCGRRYFCDVNDSRQVDMAISEIVNDVLPLMWHPDCSSTKQQYQYNTNNNPTCVKAWIEMGSQLRGKLVHPKFCWKLGPEEQNESTLEQISFRLSKIDLLEILRVTTHNTIDKSKYPFAKAHHCFEVETSSTGNYFFEASSEYDRDRIVTGLKLTIARLGSKIVLGDESVFDEFFSPYGAETPGLPPEFLR